MWQAFYDAIREGCPLSGIVCPKYSKERGVDVYRNNYRGSLQQALSGAYPVVQQLVGVAFFTQLAKQYIAQYSLSTPNLHSYGEHFSYLIRSLESCTQLPYLSDMARLEWAYHCAYFAPNRNFSLWQQLATIEDFSNVCLALHPSVCLLDSIYAVSSIWQAHQQNLANLAFVDVDNNEYILVCRPQANVEIIELPAADFEWLALLKQGVGADQATQQIMDQYSDFSLTESLAHWGSKGVITGIYY